MTHHVASMLQTYPKDLGTIDQPKLAECIEACFECTDGVAHRWRVRPSPPRKLPSPRSARA